jgi:hypothetical protein
MRWGIKIRPRILGLVYLTHFGEPSLITLWIRAIQLNLISGTPPLNASIPSSLLVSIPVSKIENFGHATPEWFNEMNNTLTKNWRADEPTTKLYCDVCVIMKYWNSQDLNVT